jgi:hypothetical protein
MIKIGEIIKRHNEQLQEEIQDAIIEYEFGEKKRPGVKFIDTPTFSISQDIELGLNEKVYRYTISVAILSGEDQRTEQVKKVLKEIEEDPNVEFH